MAHAEHEPVPLQDRPGVPAELIFLAVMGALLALVALAGVPLLHEPTAGGGSEALRHGWAKQLTPATDSPARPPESATSRPLPTGRGREPESGAR